MDNKKRLARRKKATEDLKAIHKEMPELIRYARPGQPTKYRAEFCPELIAHMSTGLSFESFAGEKHVDQETLYEWARVQPEFSQAKKKGRECNRLFWEKIGIAGATGKLNNFNSTAYIFNKKNRFPVEWRDRQEVHQTSTFEPVVIELGNGNKIQLGMEKQLGDDQTT